MTDKAISPLRRRLIEDMTIRRLSPKTQLHYIRHVKRSEPPRVSRRLFRLSHAAMGGCSSIA
jgi:hypothetical protein